MVVSSPSPHDIRTSNN